MRKLSIISVLLLAAIVTGCAGSEATSPGASLPALPEYNEEFRMTFADEVEEICSGMYPKSCNFIQDALKLRAQLKAIKETD